MANSSFFLLELSRILFSLNIFDLRLVESEDVELCIPRANSKLYNVRLSREMAPLTLTLFKGQLYIII